MTVPLPPTIVGMQLHLIPLWEIKKKWKKNVCLPGIHRPPHTSSPHYLSDTDLQVAFTFVFHRSFAELVPQASFFKCSFIYLFIFTTTWWFIWNFINCYIWSTTFSNEQLTCCFWLSLAPKRCVRSCFFIEYVLRATGFTWWTNSIVSYCWILKHIILR